MRAQMQNVSSNGPCRAGTIRAGAALYNDFKTHIILLISEGDSGEIRHIKLLLCGGLYIKPLTTNPQC